MRKLAVTASILIVAMVVMVAIPVVTGDGIAQDQATRTLRCWKCQKSFEVPASQKQGQCPYCGAKYVLAPPTPLPAPTPPPGSEPESISYKDGPRFVGQTKAVKGTIVNSHLSERSGVLYLNFDPDFKNNLSIKIAKEDLGKFPSDADTCYNGKTVIATGRIAKEKNYLRLNVTDPSNLVVLE